MYSNADLSGIQVYSLRNHGAKYRVSENFTLKEFACNDGSDVVLIHHRLPALLEAIRLEFGGPLRINSAYRSHQHNAFIGGDDNSRHLYGYAADIWIPGVYPDSIADLAEHIGAGGVGRYNAFTHVDVWGNGRRWRG